MKDKAAKQKKPKAAPLIIGWRERISLPDLGLVGIKAKIDTGARTTALHADHIRTFDHEGALWVEFHPFTHDGLPDGGLCRARVHDHRPIKNTSGVPQERIVIRTHLHIADRNRLIEVSLSDRADMTFPIIVGRTALRAHQLLVQPGHSWLTTPLAHAATPPMTAEQGTST